MTPDRLAEYALAAGDYVRRALRVELDGSVESLAFVDHYCAQVGAVDDRVLGLIAAAIGAYFGETVIGRLGGGWQADGADPAAWTITLDAAPLTFHPVAMAAEAIRQDDLPEWDSSIATLPKFEEPLADALAAVPPVEASYYYSLTGRLETLEHAAEVIAELRRLDERERDEPGDEQS